MSKHTPGPWVVKMRPSLHTASAHYTIENPSFDGPCPCGGKHPPGRLIAWMAGGLGDADLVSRHPEMARNDPEAEADARLIAAAPDLLDALQDVLAWIDEVGAEAKRRDTERLAPARAAVAKAEGPLDGGEGGK